MTNSHSPPSGQPRQIGGMKYKLVRERLGSEPVDWIKKQRDLGLSFREIAPRLSKAAREYVSYETVRSWFREAYPETPPEEE